MNQDLNNEEYPRLVPPDVVYEHKSALRKKHIMIPLYAKIITAAATVALLMGIFWNRLVMPKQELLFTLQAIEAVRIESNEPVALAESQANFIVPKSVARPAKKFVSNKRVETPFLEELQPIPAMTLMNVECQFDILSVSDVYYAYNDMPILIHENNESNLSLIGKGIFRLTEGECDSFAGIFSEGLRSVKTEATSLAATIQSSRSQLRQKVR